MKTETVEEFLARGGSVRTERPPAWEGSNHIWRKVEGWARRYRCDHCQIFAVSELDRRVGPQVDGLRMYICRHQDCSSGAVSKPGTPKARCPAHKVNRDVD